MKLASLVICLLDFSISSVQLPDQPLSHHIAAILPVNPSDYIPLLTLFLSGLLQFPKILTLDQVPPALDCLITFRMSYFKQVVFTTSDHAPTGSNLTCPNSPVSQGSLATEVCYSCAPVILTGHTPAFSATPRPCAHTHSAAPAVTAVPTLGQSSQRGDLEARDVHSGFSTNSAVLRCSGRPPWIPTHTIPDRTTTDR